MVAYVARYGHQPVRDILTMNPRDLEHFYEALGGIVQEENAKKAPTED